jgi:hypothetical protein
MNSVTPCRVWIPILGWRTMTIYPTYGTFRWSGFYPTPTPLRRSPLAPGLGPEPLGPPIATPAGGHHVPSTPAARATERRASAAPGSRSEGRAEATRRRLQADVRLVATFHDRTAGGNSPALQRAFPPPWEQCLRRRGLRQLNRDEEGKCV